MLRCAKNYGFIIAVSATIAVTVIICVCAATCSAATLDFETTFCFVCYRAPENSISAGSLSGTVSSYGGAGYILNHDGDYYVTVSCYYSQNDAETVCANLKRKELDCSVLVATTEKYRLTNGYAKRNSKLYEGNLNTLNSLSRLAYDCANGLDTGEFSQGKANEVISAIRSGLSGLSAANTDNCFTDILKRLDTECDDRQGGFIYSKDMRYIQIAIADVIINAELS